LTRNAPRTLVILLVAVLVIRLPLLVNGGGMLKVQFLLLALIIWFALRGKEAAAALFAGLTMLGAIGEGILLVPVITGARHFAPLAPYLAIDIFQILVAIYVFRSKAVATYFARSATPDSNDGKPATDGS
jgi:hypothetical protein